MHSFGLTERWLVLAEFPFVVNPLRLAFSGRPYIENYRWKPELGTRFTLLDRATGEATWAVRDRRVLRLPPRQRLRGGRRGRRRHLRASPTPGSSRTSTSSGCGPASRSRTRSWRASGSRPARTGASRTSGWSRSGIDLPRINYGRCNERPYRYVWGVGTDERVARPDRQGRRVERRETIAWAEPGCYPGEPVFVAAPEAEAEDDGRAALGRPRRRARGFVPARPGRRAASTSSPGPRCRTTSRSASTASSRPRADDSDNRAGQFWTQPDRARRGVSRILRPR